MQPMLIISKIRIIRTVRRHFVVSMSVKSRNHPKELGLQPASQNPNRAIEAGSASRNGIFVFMDSCLAKRNIIMGLPSPLTRLPFSFT